MTKNAEAPMNLRVHMYQPARTKVETVLISRRGQWQLWRDTFESFTVGGSVIPERTLSTVIVSANKDDVSSYF